MARQAGAKVVFNHEVVDIMIAGGNSLGDVEVKGVVVKDIKKAETLSIQADIVADDTGFNAVLRTKLPLPTGIAGKFSDEEFAMVHRTVRKRNKNAIDPVADHYRYGYNTGYQWMQYLKMVQVCDSRIPEQACP